MSSYARQTSPSSRRTRESPRETESGTTRYVVSRHGADRVIPISTQTFLNPPRQSSSLRRNSLVDRTRRPVLHDLDRPASPPRVRDYYVVPSTPEKSSHKKVYSIGEDGAKLVEHHRHRRGESYDKRYPATRKSIDDDDAFSYTDAAGMFRDTQPSWRERPRETSLDRSRDEPRVRRRDGPPPSLRGWDKVHDLGRTRSVREAPVEKKAQTDRRADSDYDDDFRRPPRQSSTTRRDRSVSRRGFGIRPESPGRVDGDDERRHRESQWRGYGPRAESPDADLYRARSPTYESDRHARLERRRAEPRQESPPEAYTDHRRDRSRDDVKLAAAGLAAAGAGLYSSRRERAHSVNDRPRGHEDDQYSNRRRDDDSRRDGSRRSREDDRQSEEDRRQAARRYRDDLRSPAYPPDDRGFGFAFERPEAKRASPPAEEKTDNHEAPPLAIMPAPATDPDEEYRKRIEQAQRELGYTPAPHDDADRERRRREREHRQQSRHDAVAGAESPRSSADGGRPDLRRRSSIIDEPLPAGTQAQIIDNSLSDKREGRVRIVDPPTEEEDKRPKGILKRPTVKFPEDHNTVREGVAPLKDATKKGIPPGARWTKIDRRLVNPKALEEAKERYEERQDCVIVLRVLTKEDIQKLADRTKELRENRFETERRAREREERDEYSDDGLEPWERDEKKPVRMLEAAAPVDGRRAEHRDRDGHYSGSRDRD